ncbi:hypothetical protein GCM10025786_05360 [Nocardioides caeni]
MTVKGPNAGSPRGRGGSGTATAVIALAAALTVALGAIIWLLVDRPESSSDAPASSSAELEALREEKVAGRDALAEAKAFLATATTYSWREGEHDFAWLDKLGNAEVRSGIEEAIVGLEESIVDQRLTAQGEVVDAAARVVDPSRVEVLAFVDQLLARADDDQVSIDQMRIVVTMQRTDGEWLVDDLVFQSGGLGQAEDERALD